VGQPVTVPVTLSGGTTVVVESIKATGQILPPPGPKGIAYASDNPAVATYATDGAWKPVAAGVANMSQLDQDNGLTDTTVLTVTAAVLPVADTLVGTLVPNATRTR
jgi:hypothetical protein